MRIELMIEKLENIKAIVKKLEDVPCHILNDLEYMEKCINKGDSWGAYHTYGVVVKKVMNLNKNY